VDDLTVWDVGVVDLEGFAEDDVEVGEADAADDHQARAAQLLHRAAVVRHFLAQFAEHDAHGPSRGSGIGGDHGGAVRACGYEQITAHHFCDLLLELCQTVV
jgi:hypothetical protein